jgi:hypothetical protein
METQFAWIFFAIEAIYVIIAIVEYETKHFDMANLFFGLSFIPGGIAVICFSMVLNAH